MRTSSVDSININSVTLSSIVELGDSSMIQGFSRALAIQREQELSFGNEGDFSAYSIFSEKLPLLPITEALSLQIDNQASPIIKVKNIKPYRDYHDLQSCKSEAVEWCKWKHE